MDLVYSILEMFAAAVRAIWPGVLVAALGGYFGYSALGFAGFLIGAAAGALAGTWIGDRLGLLKVSKLTGTSTGDQLLYAGAAFAVVAGCYFLWNFMILLLAIAAIGMLVSFWLSG